jgi:hypothetical protein
MWGGVDEEEEKEEDVHEGGASADCEREEGEDSGDGSAVSDARLDQYMREYEQRTGHAQGVARAQMDDAYLYGTTRRLVAS